MRIEERKTFVLVHGSWQGAWCWDAVRERLQAHGHRVLAPTLPGRGAVSEDRSSIGHEDNVASVLAALDLARDEPVVLVGHSLGGVTTSQVADRRPEQIDRLVYCAAFVLEDGQAAADLMPEAHRAAFVELASFRPDRAIGLPWELWRASFIQTADKRLARDSFTRLVPDPYRPVFEPVRLRRPVHRELPTCFIALRDDPTFPAGFWHPGITSRLDGASIVDIDVSQVRCWGRHDQIQRWAMELVGVWRYPVKSLQASRSTGFVWKMTVSWVTGDGGFASSARAGS